MSKTKYADKLKDPRWQKKRLEIFNRDNWGCCYCGRRDRTLVVHHLDYMGGVEPWDAPNEDLITLCEECHKSSYFKPGHINSCEYLIIKMLRRSCGAETLYEKIILSFVIFGNEAVMREDWFPKTMRFYVPQHIIMCDVLGAVFKRGEPIDPAAIHLELERRGLADEAKAFWRSCDLREAFYPHKGV